MKVAVLGSGSRGNAVALQTESGTLLIDAGFGIKSLRRRAKAVGIQLDSVVGILVTHEHGDHSRGAAALARELRCSIFGSQGTVTALTRRYDILDAVALPVEEPTAVSEFEVTTCHTDHDALEPIALAVQHRTTRLKLGLACDVGRPTRRLKELLQDCHCLMVEANHDEDMLHRGPYPAHVRRRIAGSGGHLSNRAAASLVRGLIHPELYVVVLLHLSDRCNRPELAKREIRAVLDEQGFKGCLRVAHQDQPMKPFAVGHAAEQLSLEVSG